MRFAYNINLCLFLRKSAFLRILCSPTYSTGTWHSYTDGSHQSHISHPPLPPPIYIYIYRYRTKEILEQLILRAAASKRKNCCSLLYSFERAGFLFVMFECFLFDQKVTKQQNALVYFDTSILYICEIEYNIWKQSWKKKT